MADNIEMKDLGDREVAEEDNEVAEDREEEETDIVGNDQDELLGYDGEGGEDQAKLEERRRGSSTARAFGEA